jgi:hypothetical protein
MLEQRQQVRGDLEGTIDSRAGGGNLGALGIVLALRSDAGMSVQKQPKETLRRGKGDMGCDAVMKWWRKEDRALRARFPSQATCFEITSSQTGLQIVPRNADEWDG